MVLNRKISALFILFSEFKMQTTVYLPTLHFDLHDVKPAFHHMGSFPVLLLHKAQQVLTWDVIQV